MALPIAVVAVFTLWALTVDMALLFAVVASFGLDWLWTLHARMANMAAVVACLWLSWITAVVTGMADFAAVVALDLTATPERVGSAVVSPEGAFSRWLRAVSLLQQCMRKSC
ncbi:hypothetical protein BX070DRAFT_30314 [Coemansia spiralis]|nr:hypothetical protein BX070DRAFT_30314 [Coemansia spiralis]